MSYIHAIIAHLNAWWQWYYLKLGLLFGAPPKWHMGIALAGLLVALLMVRGLYIITLDTLFFAIRRKIRRWRVQRRARKTVARTRRPVPVARRATALPPTPKPLSPATPRPSASPDDNLLTPGPAASAKPVKAQWPVPTPTLPDPLAADADDKVIWERIQKLVAYFRDQAVQKCVAYNAMQPGDGAVILGLSDDRYVEHVRFVTVGKTAGWTTQTEPTICGRMEVYITNKLWEVVSSYVDFTADGTTTYKQWRLDSSRPGKSEVRRHPKLHRTIGVTVREAHDFVEQFIQDLLDPRY